MINANDLQLKEILPGSISQDKQVIAACDALQPQINSINTAIPDIEIYRRIDELPEPILRMLAVENRVFSFEWQLAETIEAKRELVKNSFDLNKRRGTRWAVERVLGLLDIEFDLKEWFEYGGTPYCFTIDIASTNQTLTADKIRAIFGLVNNYRPLRTNMERFAILTEADKVTGYCGAANTVIAVLDCLPYNGVIAPITVNAESVMFSGISLVAETYPS